MMERINEIKSQMNEILTKMDNLQGDDFNRKILMYEFYREQYNNLFDELEDLKGEMRNAQQSTRKQIN